MRTVSSVVIKTRIPPVTHEWETGLCEISQVKQCGGFCCLQHCCCQPCVVASAVRNSNLKDADLIGFGLIFGGRSALDEVATYFTRRKVVDKYGIDETELRSLLISCCCGPCSNLQVVNTLMVRERLKYACASTEKEAPPPKRSAPRTVRMTR